jgi:VWFA-related protein
LAAFAESLRASDAERANVVLGEWHALVELTALGHAAGTLGAKESASAFRCACTSLQTRDFSRQALACLRAMTGESAGLDEAVPSRLLRLDGARRAAFDRVRRLQNVPRLDAVIGSAGDAQTVAALSGLVYAASLDPDSLLISEDPLALRKHRFTSADPAKGPGLLFLPAALVRPESISGTIAGSYLGGGFAGLDEVARELPRVDSAEEPAAAAPDSAPKVAAKVAFADPPPMPTESVFRASGRLVEVFATVTDGRGRYIDNLPESEFGLLEEGTPRRITAFESNSSAVSCALVLDTTASMQGALPALKNAAMKLIDDLRENDAVAVYRFDRTVALLQPLTTDKQVAKRAVLRAFPRDETALYDALTQVAREISGRGGKKVIVVFTDGEDNRSILGAEAAIRRAKVIGAPVYTVAQGRALEYDELLKQLWNVSKATGGVPFAIREPREIRAVLERVGQDLAHGYLLAFPPTPAQDNNWRRIDVRLQHPRGYKVRAREGYYPE